MVSTDSNLDKKVLDDQGSHWEKAYSGRQDMFGIEITFPAQQAVEKFKKAQVINILELGAGQGRDTFYFAQNNFNVHVLDYCKTGIDAIVKKADELSLNDKITTRRHDIRKPFPLKDNSFDGCYSHMLYCTALTSIELAFLSSEIRRLLKPGGLNIYTVRHKGDAHFGQGIYRGEDMYEMSGYIVHYFDEKMVHYLAKGYKVLSIDEFEEGNLPRKLLQVIMQKK